MEDVGLSSELPSEGPSHSRQDGLDFKDSEGARLCFPWDHCKSGSGVPAPPLLHNTPLALGPMAGTLPMPVCNCGRTGVSTV